MTPIDALQNMLKLKLKLKLKPNINLCKSKTKTVTESIGLTSHLNSSYDNQCKSNFSNPYPTNFSLLLFSPAPKKERSEHT